MLQKPLPLQQNKVWSFVSPCYKNVCNTHNEKNYNIYPYYRDYKTFSPVFIRLKGIDLFQRKGADWCLYQWHRQFHLKYTFLGCSTCKIAHLKNYKKRVQFRVQSQKRGNFGVQKVLHKVPKSDIKWQVPKTQNPHNSWVYYRSKRILMKGN